MQESTGQKILCVQSGVSTNIQQLGPYGIETLIELSEEGKTTAYRVHIQPNSKTSTSYHQVAEELYYVLSGSGIAFLNGKPFELKPGIFMRLPPGTWHAFEAFAEGLDMLDVHSPGAGPTGMFIFPKAKHPRASTSRDRKALTVPDFPLAGRGNIQHLAVLRYGSSGHWVTVRL